MIKFASFAAAGAFAFAIGASQTAVAQSVNNTATDQQAAFQNRQQEVNDRRQASSNRASRTRDRRQQAPAAPSPEQNRADAQALLTTMGASCTVTEANLLGQTAEGIKVYEAACQTGPGYVVQSTTPPAGGDCLVLASQAQISRERDPAADVGTLCNLPANQNILPIYQAYAAEAGVPCTVNEGLAVGRTNAGAVLYEVGCENAGGWRLERGNDAWTKVNCLQLSSQGFTCRFTTKAEILTDIKGLLAGSESAACDPADVRYMGANPNGEFIEVACSAGTESFIARVKDGVTQQTYPCSTAQQIGDGCKLGAAPAAAAAPASQD